LAKNTAIRNYSFRIRHFFIERTIYRLSMSIFSAKFSVGMMRSMLPHLQGSMVFLGLELFSTIILGIFAGRATSCFLRYRSTDTEIMKHDA